MEENNRHAWETGLMDREKHRRTVSANGKLTGPKSIKFAQEANKRSVTQFGLSGNVLKTYSSVTEAQDITGVPHQTISRVCLESKLTKLRFHDFYFRYTESDAELGANDGIK